MSDCAGGCEHVHARDTAEPIDNHGCPCNLCKAIIGQRTTHAHDAGRGF